LPAPRSCSDRLDRVRARHAAGADQADPGPDQGQLESWKCGIDYVFYGLNDDPIEQEWQLEACDPDNQNVVLKDKPYLELPLGSAQSISVQLIFKDGTKSAVERFEYKSQ
jgi:hypothetical protein